MEPKDWIILLVPILIEGIIIAFYNKHLEKRFEETRLKRKRRTKKEEYFMDLVDEARKKYHQMRLAMNGGSLSEWEKTIGEFSEFVQKIYSYYKSYSNTLDKYAVSVTDIFAAQQTIINTVTDVVNCCKKNNEADRQKLLHQFMIIEQAFNQIDEDYKKIL